MQYGFIIGITHVDDIDFASKQDQQAYDEEEESSVIKQDGLMKTSKQKQESEIDC